VSHFIDSFYMMKLMTKLSMKRRRVTKLESAPAHAARSRAE
jgi:hypothetical protein